MLNYHPYQCCMGKQQPDHLILAPVLNTIDTILGHILEKSFTKAELSSEETRFAHEIFLRAANLFNQISMDFAPNSNSRNKSHSTSYLGRLISALQYIQEPEYVIKTVLTATRFITKKQRDLDNLDDKESLHNLVKFALPYLRLFQQNGYHFEQTFGHISDLLQKSSAEGFQLESWFSYLSILPGVAASTQDLLKVLENPETH